MKELEGGKPHPLDDGARDQGGGDHCKRPLKRHEQKMGGTQIELAPT